MKNTSLILVRHGQSEWNEKNLFTGWENPGLTKKGADEAILAGKLIKELNINFDRMFTSALIRAQLTGSIILEKIGANAKIAFQNKYLPMQGLPELRDAVANYISSKKNHNYKAENILIGPGTKELMSVSYTHLTLPTKA